MEEKHHILQHKKCQKWEFYCLKKKLWEKECLFNCIAVGFAYRTYCKCNDTQGLKKKESISMPGTILAHITTDGISWKTQVRMILT